MSHKFLQFGEWSNLITQETEAEQGNCFPIGIIDIAAGPTLVKGTNLKKEKEHKLEKKQLEGKLWTAYYARIPV